MLQEHVPEQEIGASTDTDYSVICNLVEEAKQLYQKARQRLLAINEWKDYAGIGSAVFTLTDNKGNSVNRIPQKGDYFMIDIPGPGNSTGHGYDWVEVEALDDMTKPEQDVENIAMCVRPAADPRDKNSDISHFFRDEATSTFMIAREGKKLTASVHGRNEIANTVVHGVLDKARNALVALSAQAGGSRLQWSLLVHGLLAP